MLSTIDAWGLQVAASEQSLGRAFSPEMAEQVASESKFLAIPCSRAYFLYLRFFGVHPITWRHNGFVTSGFGFSIVVFIVTAVCSTSVAFSFLEISPIAAKRCRRVNPIQQDIDSFFSVIKVLFRLLAPTYLIVLRLKRKALASTFNDINTLWNMWVYLSVQSDTWQSLFSEKSADRTQSKFALLYILLTLYSMTVEHNYGLNFLFWQWVAFRLFFRGSRRRPLTIYFIWTVVPFILHQLFQEFDLPVIGEMTAAKIIFVSICKIIIGFAVVASKLGSTTSFSLMIFVYGVVIQSANEVSSALDNILQRRDSHKCDLLKASFSFFCSYIPLYSSNLLHGTIEKVDLYTHQWSSHSAYIPENIAAIPISPQDIFISYLTSCHSGLSPSILRDRPNTIPFCSRARGASWFPELDSFGLLRHKSHFVLDSV